MRELNLEEVNSIYGGAGDIAADLRREPHYGEPARSGDILPWDLASMLGSTTAESIWR